MLLDREDLESSDGEILKVDAFDDSDLSENSKHSEEGRILDDSDFSGDIGQDSFNENLRVGGDDQGGNDKLKFEDFVAEEFDNLRKLAKGGEGDKNEMDDFNSVMVQESARQTMGDDESVSVTTASLATKRNKAKIPLTKESLQRNDIPVFDCIYCIENSSKVMEGVLKSSLREVYFDSCRYISNNE